MEAGKTLVCLCCNKNRAYQHQRSGNYCCTIIKLTLGFFHPSFPSFFCWERQPYSGVLLVRKKGLQKTAFENQRTQQQQKNFTKSLQSECYSLCHKVSKTPGKTAVKPKTKCKVNKNQTSDK